MAPYAMTNEEVIAELKRIVDARYQEQLRALYVLFPIIKKVEVHWPMVK